MRTFGTFLLALFSSAVGAWMVQAPTASITAVTRAHSPGVWTAEVTQAPAVHPDLLRRDIRSGTRTAFLAETNVCGYLNGNSVYGIGCNVGYRATCGLFVDNTLASASASQGAMGCCYNPTVGQTTTNCAVFTTCLDYSMLSTVDSCANFCGPSEHTLQCTASNLPYCSSFRFRNVFTEAAPGVDFVGYMCVTAQGGVAQAAYTTYLGQGSTMPFSTTTVLFLEMVSGSLSSKSSSSSSSSSASSSASSSTPSTSSSSPTSSPTTSSPATSSAVAPPSSTTPVGPIVGGVLGGVVVLGAAAAGIFFWRRKHRATGPPGDDALSSSRGHQPYYPPQELYGLGSGQELAHKTNLVEVSGERGVHEVMGTEVYR